MKYLITSGNSQTGKATIRSLKALGENDIRAGARYDFPLPSFSFPYFFLSFPYSFLCLFPLLSLFPFPLLICFVFLFLFFLCRDPVKSEVELKKAGASEVVEFDFTKPGSIPSSLSKKREGDREGCSL